jgi:hypothetical protein
MKRLMELIIPAGLSIAFIILTAFIGSGEYFGGTLQQFCFMFHVIPFGIGFSGGENYLAVIYYFILWIALTFMFLGIRRLITLIFKPPA